MKRINEFFGDFKNAASLLFILSSLNLLNLLISFYLQFEISSAFDIIGTLIKTDNAILKIIKGITLNQDLLKTWIDSLQATIS